MSDWIKVDGEMYFPDDIEKLVKQIKEMQSILKDFLRIIESGGVVTMSDSEEKFISDLQERIQREIER